MRRSNARGVGRRRGGGRRARSSPAHTTSIALLRPGDRRAPSHDRARRVSAFAASVVRASGRQWLRTNRRARLAAKDRDARVKGTTRARAAARTTTGTTTVTTLASRLRRQESRGRLARARVLRVRTTTSARAASSLSRVGQRALQRRRTFPWRFFAQRLGANIRRGVSRGVSELRKVETSEPMQGLRDFFGRLGGASGGSSGARAVRRARATPISRWRGRLTTTLCVAAFTRSHADAIQMNEQYSDHSGDRARRHPLVSSSHAEHVRAARVRHASRLVGAFPPRRSRLGVQ